MTARGAVVVALVLAAAAGAAEPSVLEFHRVHVPAGRLGEVPLGDERHVPLPLADFDAVVARARAAAEAGGRGAPANLPVTARWRATLAESGALVGTISCDVGPSTAGPGRVLPLGDLRARRATRAGDPPREATVCGVGAGLALAIPEPGTYELDFACPPEAADAAAFRLPLVPALATSLVLELPPGLRPVPSGASAPRAVVTPPAGAADPWRIDLGPAAELRLAIEPRDRQPAAVAVWAEVELSPARAALAAVVAPEAPWRAGRLVLEQDPTLRVTEARAADDAELLDHEVSADGRAVAITLPRRLDGRRVPLVVRGVAPATGPVWRLPLLRAAGAWAGGGSIVTVDPAFAMRDVELDDCRVVSPEVAAAWPRVAGAPAGGDGGPGGGAAARRAVYHVEQQGPAATLGIEIGPRSASFDVARVTTVDIASNAVLGRAACDVRVTGGEAFEITARVAPGWIIDAVDAVDDGDTAARGAASPDRAVEWRVVPSPAGDELRIGLAFGAAGGRGIGLRIAGHRAGLAPGAVFTTADIDMVRFDGEEADAAVIDLRTDADAFVEIAGRPAGWFEVEGRLAPLVEEGPARGRIRGGDRAGDGEARLVRRRPPLDVRVGVRLEPRDEGLVETFTFDCSAASGVESLVVDFGAPGGAGLAWRVESPAGVIATARPLDPAEGGLASRGEGIADSWLVDLSPAASGPVRLRAVRTVPFTAAVPVPRAWVDGAVEPGGTVVVAAASAVRPRLVNRRLRELPVDPDAPTAPAEFAYGPPTPGAADELAPAAPGADARAWAWRETVSCWCDESGAAETESRFDVENEGRGRVSLSLAPGRRLESVLVGGVAAPGVEFGPDGGTWIIPLPAGQQRLEIVVRTLAAGRPGRGAWRVDPVACSLDVPVLDRDVRLLVPPQLVVATSAEDGRATGMLPWSARLFGVGAPAAASASSATGYRAVAAAASRDRAGGVLVLRRGFLAGAAILAAVAAGIASFLRGRRRPASAAMLAAAAAVTALWLPVAFVPVARAAWWGALTGLGWALRPDRALRARWPRRAVAAAGLAAALAVPPAAGAAEQDFPVFVMPGAGGDTVLVPETLFRALAAFVAPEAATIRVLDCRIATGGAEAGPEWMVALDVEADAGGTLRLDAGPGARWLPARAAAAGVGVEVALDAGGREALLTAALAGRQTVELAVVPAVERRGAVETVTLRIPPAPVATVRIGAGPGAPGTLECERSTGPGPFVRVAPVADRDGAAAFDVSVSDRVRIIRPVDPRDRLAAAVRAAHASNDLSWDRGGCGVEARFELDAGQDLLRSFVVRVDPRLEGLGPPDAAAAAPRLVPLGGGRVLVELPEPARGSARVTLAARLPLADPVGLFDVPGIWLAGVPTEVRTVRLSAAPDFDAALDPPPAAGATAAELAARAPPRVIVRRRRPQVRAAQGLAVSFSPTGLGLALEAQVDAATIALARIPIDVPVGCVVDRVTLVADDPAEPGAGEAVDAVWTRTAADRVLLVVQQPRPGRFRLEVDARLARRPAPRGRLPVVRARLGTAAPLLVSWTAAPPLAVNVQGAAGTVGRPDGIEVPDGAPDPDYELTMLDERRPDAPAGPAVADDVEASGVELAEVRVVFDGRGHVHGLARFDVFAAVPVVRLRLPAGMRLFDVLVDGRTVAAEPREADAWDVPLGAAAWPRTILAVFTGDAGAALADGRPLALAAPRIEGLPAAEVLWSLRPPAGLAFEVAPSARPLDAAAFAAARSAAHDRVAAACERIAAGGAEPERARLEALAALRRADRGPAAEESWRRAAGWDDAGAGCVAVAAAEPLVLRAVPVPDDTRPARAVATVALIAGAGLAWTVVARGRPARARG